ncbi:MAG: PAS domain S-box protein [Deltaproteobacteria bacterium]|nr:PAS domain S-box protein [Deltaproteobacteria bacterium]
MTRETGGNYQIYKNIFENLYDAYIHMDKTGNIAIASPSCLRIFGLPPEDMQGKNFFNEFIVDNLKIKQFMEKINSEGQVSEFEMTIRKVDGTKIWVSTNANYFLDESGKITGIESTTRDITERKNLEEQLIRAERMAAVGTLAGGVAHEFNNINLAILGYAELGLFREGLEQEVKNYFSTIRKSALRARAITSNLLTFSGSRIGKIGPANLNKVVDETIIMLSHEVSSSGIEIITQKGETPDTIMDATQIGQVVLNILINAHHALTDREKKEITVRTGHNRFNVFVSISDTGWGIPNENLLKIFSPFFTTKGEHSDGSDAQNKVKGTGLGLSVSHTIVANHKGDIKVESEVGSGTTFTVSLPIVSGTTERDTIQSFHATGKMPTASILILDDEPDLRELLDKFYSSRGHTVYHTGSGEHALQIISEKNIDVVLVDLQMPQMTGREFLKKARNCQTALKPAYIVITGKSIEPEEHMNDDIFCVVYKPFKLNEIFDKTREAIFSRLSQIQHM